VILFAPFASAAVTVTWGTGSKAPLPSGAATSNQFVGVASVSCTSAGNCVAVGNYDDTTPHQQGLLLTETNGTWAAAKAPLPAGAGSGVAAPGVFLTSVSCFSLGNCAAVGSYIDTSNHQQGLLLTDSGGAWSAVKAVLPAGAATDPAVDMSSVSCSDAGNCVAAGSYFDSSNHLQSALFTESGFSWGQGVEVQPPAAAANPIVSVNSVSCSPVGDCAAVGSYQDSSNDVQGLLLTESSGTWTAAKATMPAGADSNPGVTLTSVSCAPTGECAAVGSYSASNNPQGVLLTESSGTWGDGVEATLPADAGSQPGVALSSVSCASAGNCGAVGSYFDDSFNQHIVLLDESSGAWGDGVEATLPDNAGSSPGYAAVMSVSCASAGNCSAVGSYLDNGTPSNQQALMLSESDGTWQQGVEATLPADASPPPASPALYSVSCPSAGSCSAVGTYQNAQGVQGLLIGAHPAPPANQTAPAITGTTTEGQTLTASQGTWSGSPTSYAYQWQRCDGAGATCSAVGGATAGTYVLTSSDAGHTIRVQVTATNAGGSTPATSAQTAVVLPLPPSNTSVPTISGTTTEGQTLTEAHGGWTHSPTSYAYQWQDCNSAGNSCSDISGATSQTYVLQTSDVGDTIRVQETATNAGGHATATSAQTAVVLPLPPANTSLPTISGTTTQGQTLTEAPGAWTHSPTSYAYQWQDCDSAGTNCSAIGGATNQTYVLQATDVGHTIRVKETATNAGGSGNAASAQTAVVLSDWTLTGSLSTARFGQTATLLPNGKVLVAGGKGPNGDVASAELYNPATGTWSSAGSMSTARLGQTATLLPNGKVLVAGGVNSSGILASAELYDPAAGTAGTWSPTGSMTTVRSFQTATLLANGKVLVEGGTGTGSAELYDPATGTWSSTGSMSTARYGQTATLLQNGKVLVAGGSSGTSGGPSFASAELYDPATGTWSSAGSMTAGRQKHTATLLSNGKVLVVGGRDSNGTDLATAELYDPASGTSGTWSPTGPMTTARANQTATLLANGKVLVAGGYLLASAELYDPAAGTWSSADSMSTARELHTATLLPSGKVLVVGGRNPNASWIATASLYMSTGSGSAPLNLVPPSISGTAAQGQTLTAHQGLWTGNPTSYAYQWQDCDSVGNNCSPIGGATSQTYVVQAGDAGHTIDVQETATNADGSGNAASAVALPPAPSNTSLPTISGTATQGQTLTEAHGVWANSPTSYTYQWQDCDSSGASCSDISGATGQTYVLKATDAGHTIRVKETATNEGGSATATSAQTAVVLPLAPSNTSPPTISGTATQGQTLTEAHGAWANSPTSYAYQWQDCDSAGNSCSDISGATSQTYVLQATDAGHTIRVQETATNAGGSATATSAASTAVVPLAPAVTTTAASGVTDSSVELNGTVNPNGSATTYYFQYGPTTSYGLRTASTSAGSGTSATSVTSTVGFLSAATTYHYRIVADSAAGTVSGADMTFTTEGSGGCGGGSCRFSFSGKVKSSNSACVGGRKVSVIRKSNGAKIGSAVSDNNGVWKATFTLNERPKSGAYFASVPKKDLNKTKECGAAQSPTVQVPARRHGGRTGGARSGKKVKKIPTSLTIQYKESA
jgi:Kelch motif protein/galactose oxidase-like protein